MGCLTIFSESNGAATGQSRHGVAIYNRSLPWWDHFRHVVQPMSNRDIHNSQISRAMVTLLEDRVMLNTRSETSLTQQRRSQSVAGKYLLETQRDFSHNFHRFWVYNQRIKASNTTPLLIVRWSCDSIKKKETMK